MYRFLLFLLLANPIVGYPVFGNTCLRYPAIELPTFAMDTPVIDSTELWHFLSTGQSLSIGVRGFPAFDTIAPYPNDLFMLSDANGQSINSGVMGRFAPLSPLRESYKIGPLTVQTAWTSALTTMLSFGLPQGLKMGLTAHGVSGACYSDIKKNGNIQAYNWGMQQSQAVRQQAGTLGWRYVPKALTLIHGECDVQAGNSLVYPSYMNELRNDYQNDLRLLTGRPNLQLPMFFSQTSSRGPAFMAPQQLNAHRDFDNEMFMVGPTYQFNTPDYVHLSNIGYKRLGELFGKVMHKVLVLEEDWSPLMPISIVREGLDIFVRYHVPVPPIAIDVTNVVERVNWNDKINKGFQFFQTGGNDSLVWIQNVAIIGPDLIKLTLNNLPTGANQRLNYAARPIFGLMGGMSNVINRYQGGNIRDSDTTTSWSSISTGLPIYNWGVSFVEPVWENQRPHFDTIVIQVTGGTPFLASPFLPFFQDDQPFDPSAVLISYPNNPVLNLQWGNDSLFLTYLPSLWPATMNGTLVYTDPYGQKDTVPIIITVVCPQPLQPDVIAPARICINNTATLSAIGGGSYVWSTGSTQPNITVAPTGTTQYSLTVTQNNCTATAAHTLIVDPLPIPTAGPTGPVCLNGILTLAASGGSAYQWSGPGGFSSNQQQPVRNPVTPGMAGNYRVTVTDVYGCSSSTQTTVTLLPSYTVQAFNNGPICEGGMLELGTSGGVSYQWSGPDNYFSAQQLATRSPSGLGAAGTYTVTATNAIGCSTQASTTVSIRPAPPITAGIASTVCLGDDIYFTMAQLNYVSYQWSGPQNFSSNQPQPFRLQSTLAMSGLYTVTVSDAFGCTNSSGALAIVHPLPFVQASNSGPFCQNGTFQLVSNGGVTHVWTGPNGFLSNNPNPAISPAVPAMAGDYVLTITDLIGCTATDTTTVLYQPPPTFQITYPAPVCLGGTLQLGTTPSTFSGFSWTGPLGFQSGLANPTFNNALYDLSGTYWVTVTDQYGCTNSTSALVSINPRPTLVALDTGACSTFNGNIPLTAFVFPSGGQLTWSGPFTTPNGQFSVPAAGIGTYTVTANYALGGNGCTASDQSVVSVYGNAAANAGNGFGICGQSPPIPLFSGQPAGGTWTGPGVSGGNSFDPTENMAAQSPIVLTYRYGIGTCLTTDTIRVAVWPSPIAVAANNGPRCEEAPLSLQAGGASQYQWSGPNGFSASGPNITLNQAMIGQSGQYVVTATDMNSCTASAATTVSVLPRPEVRGFDGDTLYCLAPGTVALPLVQPTGGNWLPAPGINGNQFSPSAVGLGNRTLQYTFTNANSCADTASFGISVVPSDSVSAGLDDTVCLNNGPVVLSGFYPPSGGFWTGPGINNPWQGIFYPTFAGTGPHILQYINLNGACQSRDTLMLNVVDVQSQVEAGPDLLYCADAAPFLLSGAFPQGGTWSGNGIANPNTGLFDPAQSGPGWHVVTYTAPFCSAYDTREVEIVALPSPSFTVQGVPQANIPVNFVNTSPNNLTYFWSFGDGGTSNVRNPSHIFTQTGTYTITLYAADANNCFSSVSQTISVVVGLEEPRLEWDAVVYPNPASDRVLINLFGPWSGTVTVEVWSWDGRPVEQIVLENSAPGDFLELPIDKLPNGAYWVKISGPQATLTKRLIVHH